MCLGGSPREALRTGVFRHRASTFLAMNDKGIPSIPEPFRRASPCPRCDGWMRTVHNPSYGVGLAIHHYIRICDGCDYAAFVPEALVKQHRDTRMRQARTSSAPVRRSWFSRRRK